MAYCLQGLPRRFLFVYSSGNAGLGDNIFFNLKFLIFDEKTYFCNCFIVGRRS